MTRSTSTTTRRKKAKPKNRFWDKKFIVTDVHGWHTQVSYAINMTEKEVLDKVLYLINTNDDRHEGREREFLTDLVRELEGWDETPTARGRMIPCGMSYIVLLRLDRNNFRKGLGVIVHEITHAVQYLLKHRRTPLVEHTEEVYAYLTEYLTTELLFALYD